MKIYSILKHKIKLKFNKINLIVYTIGNPHFFNFHL
jgi:hypothetical protein